MSISWSSCLLETTERTRVWTAGLAAPGPLCPEGSVRSVMYTIFLIILLYCYHLFITRECQLSLNSSPNTKNTIQIETRTADSHWLNTGGRGPTVFLDCHLEVFTKITASPRPVHVSVQRCSGRKDVQCLFYRYMYFSFEKWCFIAFKCFY